MEDVLRVYARPYESASPVVCFDEAAKRILSEVREPLLMECGQVLRVGSEYSREGTVALFMAFEPLAGKRHVFVRDRRAALDFAQVVRLLVEEVYPDAHRVVFVVDNLNTHGPHSLYEAFDPASAERLCGRIEWHFTPKRGSWLNIAEMELSALARQCLSERMGSKQYLECAVGAWQARRDGAKARVDWQFTTEDARVKLKQLYPKILTG